MYLNAEAYEVELMDHLDGESHRSMLADHAARLAFPVIQYQTFGEQASNAEAATDDACDPDEFLGF
ncbi:MAG: hypothetical protein ACFCUJ_05515 [Thiotrichales bacterium]